MSWGKLSTLILGLLVIIGLSFSCSNTSKWKLLKRDSVSIFIEGLFENDSLTIWIDGQEIYEGIVTTDAITGLAEAVEDIPIRKKKNIIIVKKTPKNAEVSCFEYKAVELKNYLYIDNLFGCVRMETSDKETAYF